MRVILIVASIALCLVPAVSFSFDFGSFTNSITKEVEKVAASSSSTSNTSSSQSNSTVASAIKEALTIGVDYAVETLGANNGYLSNALVAIPLPENLEKVEGIIRKVGGNDIADNLINSMNSAATQAAPQTAEIFIDAIDQMSLADATTILNGDDNAATDYFEANTTDSLKAMILPIVQEAMAENKVAGYYNKFNDYYDDYGKDLIDNSSVSSIAKNLGMDAYLPESSDQDLDDYVTGKAIDGLFKVIAQKESAIRNDPIEQATSLLKQVFGE